MHQQHPSVKANEEDIEEFLSYVIQHDNQFVIDMLEENPTLINAVSERGDTAVNFLITKNSGEEHLETLRILMRYNPDLTIRNDNEWGPFTSLQLIREPYFLRQFALTLDPNLILTDFNEGGELHPALKAIALREAEKELKESGDTAPTYTSEQLEALRRQEEDYFNNNPSHRTMGKLDPNNPKILTVLIEPTYFDPLEAQKEINRFNDQLCLNDNKAIDDFLKTISFAPRSYMSEVSSNNDLSIIVAPQDIFALLDRAQEFISGLTSYFFDSSGDNI